jgi:flagellar motor switch protein FliN/FliY
MLTAAEQALASIGMRPSANPLPPGTSPIPWEEFGGDLATTTIASPNVSASGAIRLRIELGRARIRCDASADLRTGSVVPLDNAASDSVAIYADGQKIARGELLAIDGKLAVRVVEVIAAVGED